MKKYLIILVTLLLPLFIEAQVCYIKYSYDNSGNRIQREFICGEPDVDDGSIPTDPDQGGSRGRPANIINDHGGQSNTGDIDFLVSPNPSNGKYRVSLLHEDLVGSTLEILDINGKQVHSQRLENMEFWIDITRYSNGVYYFYIKDEERVKTKEIIKH